MRVLIVEDEPNLLDTLTTRLRSEGYAVDAAGNGRDGLFAGSEYPIDLAIVDLGLPDIPGTELIKRWRAADRSFPILILTARSSWEDKVAGLELGADPGSWRFTLSPVPVSLFSVVEFLDLSTDRWHAVDLAELACRN